MVKINKTDKNADKDVGKGNLNSLLLLQTGAAHVEISMETSQKAKTKPMTYEWATPLLGICSKNATSYSTDICSAMFIDTPFIHNR